MRGMQVHAALRLPALLCRACTHMHMPLELHIWEQQSAGLAQSFPAGEHLAAGGMPVP